MVAPAGHHSELFDMLNGGSRRPLARAPMATGAGLSLDLGHLCSCRRQWPLVSTELGAAPQLSLELMDV